MDGLVGILLDFFEAVEEPVLWTEVDFILDADQIADFHGPFRQRNPDPVSVAMSM